MEFTDEELRMVGKSLSITYDALTNKLGRLKGKHHDDAVAEYRIVDSTLTKVRAELSQRYAPEPR